MRSGPQESGQSRGWNWKAVPWYVLLIAVYPTLFLLAHNITEVPVNVAFVPIAVSLAGASLLWLGLYLISRRAQRAALAAAFLLALFFLYGHVYSYLKGITFGGIFPFRHRTLLPIFGLLGGLGTWGSLRSQFNLKTTTQVLNLTLVVLLIMPIYQIGSGLVKQGEAWRQAAANPAGPTTGAKVTGLQSTPDIYYIILDSYARADRIQELYGYDNSEFLQSLEKQGFVVADCAQSNYAQTELSLSSSLNFNYLDALNENFRPGNTDRSPLRPLIRDSAIRRFLEGRGYQTIAFATGYSWSEIQDADIYFVPQIGPWELNSFQYMLLQTTAGRALLDEREKYAQNTPDDLTRRRTLFALDKLAEIPAIAGPKFVFAHLLVPHSFVFGPNGEALAFDRSTNDPKIFQEGFVDQIVYLNQRIEALVAIIIEKYATPPIIILQGDHGTTGSTRANRVSILNAYYLPGQTDRITPTMTPVNTFRVILDAYFGQDLPLLADIARYSTYQNPYDYFVQKNDCTK